jgi:hypothetical protein
MAIKFLTDGQKDAWLPKCDCAPVENTEIAGLASSAIGLIPINGLCHPESASATGWYIWCGERLSNRRDFSNRSLIERLPSNQ